MFASGNWKLTSWHIDCLYGVKLPSSIKLSAWCQVPGTECTHCMLCWAKMCRLALWTFYCIMIGPYDFVDPRVNQWWTLNDWKVNRWWTLWNRDYAEITERQLSLHEVEKHIFKDILAIASCGRFSVVFFVVIELYVVTVNACFMLDGVRRPLLPHRSTWISRGRQRKLFAILKMVQQSLVVILIDDLSHSFSTD